MRACGLRSVLLTFYSSRNYLPTLSRGVEQSSPSITARRAPPPALKRWSATAPHAATQSKAEWARSSRPSVRSGGNCGKRGGEGGGACGPGKGRDGVEEDTPSARHLPLSLYDTPLLRAGSLPPPPPPATQIELRYGGVSVSAHKKSWWKSCVCVQ